MKNNTFIRKDLLEHYGDWVWPLGDQGLWQGPSEEWPVFKAMFVPQLTSKEVCIQAGGAAGVYPKLLSDIFNHVYTFEPDPLNFYCLVNNCAEKENITFFNTALGTTNGPVNLIKAHQSNVGMHRTVEQGIDNSTRTMQLNLDSLNFNGTISFIMLDVEHNEFNVLNGAQNLIRTHKPLIQLENGLTPEIGKLMETMNYAVIGIYNADSLWKPIS